MPYLPRSLDGFDWQKVSGEQRVLFEGNQHQATLVLSISSEETLVGYFQFAVEYRREDRAFWIFDSLLDKECPPLLAIEQCIDKHPPLVYSLLKRHLIGDTGSERLPESLDELVPSILRGVIRCANELGIAALVGLEKLSVHIRELGFTDFKHLLWTSAMSIRSEALVQEVLLVLHDIRAEVRARSAVDGYGHRYAMAVAFDRTEEAHDACPCDDAGRPRRQRTAPIYAKLVPLKHQDGENPHNGTEDAGNSVMAHIRVDAVTSIRIHSHVRLQVSSRPEHSTLPPAVVDCVVLRASRGEILLSPSHPLPPEYAEVTWSMYDAGSVATSRAMMDAVEKLVVEGSSACWFHDIITGRSGEAPTPIRTTHDLDGADEQLEDSESIPASLNESQKSAVKNSRLGRMSLIWGPPGTSSQWTARTTC